MKPLHHVFVDNLGKLYPASIFFSEVEAKAYVEYNPELMICQEFHGHNPTYIKQWHVVESDHKGFEIPKLIRARINTGKGNLSFDAGVLIYIENNNANIDDVVWDNIYYHATDINEVNKLMLDKSHQEFTITSYKIAK